MYERKKKRRNTRKQKASTSKQILHRYVNILILILCMFIMIPTTTASAASNLKIQYDGKTVNYTSTQAKVTYNGKAIDLGNTPGIVVNNTTIVSYQDVFANSEIKATCSFSSKAGTITIKKGSKTIKMTVGSKVAYVNGKKKTMDTAPLKVTFVANKSSKVLVPAGFVTENLGYTYKWNNSSKTSEIVGPLNLTYDGAIYTYTGTQGKVTINGKSINVADMPSIVINGTALIRAQKVCASSSFGAKYAYNSTKKIVTLTKGSNTIKLTMGSNIAYVNDKKYTMNTAARLVKNNSTGKTYAMVPGSFVTTNLGYNYTWNSSTKTSVITTKKAASAESESGNEAISGDDAEKTYFNLGITTEFSEEYNQVNNIANNDIISTNENDTASIDTITQSTVQDGLSEQYVIKSSTPFNGISSSYEDTDTISFQLENTYSKNTNYYFDNSMVNMITSSYNSSNISTKVNVELSVKNAKYEYALSTDKLTLTITVHYNYICNITANYKANTDYVTITGMFLPEKVITEDATNIYIDLPYTIDSVGEKTNQIKNGYCLTKVTCVSTSTHSTRITIAKKTDSDYYVTESGNKLSIAVINTNVTDYEIKIKKPSNVSYSAITTEDLYLNKKFTIIIPGDNVSYYKNNPIINLSSQVKSIDVTLNSDGNTVITVSCSSILGYKLYSDGGYIAVDVGKPNEIYKNIVVLDPGHGGSFPGAIYSGVKEKDITLKILYTCLKDYFNASDSDIKVYYTRTGDTCLSTNLTNDLNARAAFAKNVGADLFISLHMNAASATSAKGTEVYYSNSNNGTTSSGLTSETLAKELVNNLTSTIGTNNRGVKSAKFVVVYKNTVPAVLIELGFLTNSSDLEKLTNTTYQKKVANCIYNTIESIFEKYPTGR